MSQGRRPLIAGNWKMNGGLDEVDALAGVAEVNPHPVLLLGGVQPHRGPRAQGAQECGQHLRLQGGRHRWKHGRHGVLQGEENVKI